MTAELVKVENTPAPRVEFFDLGPRSMVAQASEIADVLKDVIMKQKLYTSIQGKNHVRVEGWTTLGSIMGILPREKSVVALPDGSYEAVVELCNVRTGIVVGQGSAICSMEEKRWGDAPAYARRSMAVTRATGKAYRLAFSWIMTLAGYEATPAEEMLEPAQVVRKPIAGYNPKDNQMTTWLSKELEKRKIALDKWDDIGFRLQGKPSSELDNVIKSFEGQ